MEMRNGKYRILYVTPWAELGGAEVMLFNIVKYHNRTRFEPVVCFLRPGPLVERMRELDCEVVVVPTGRMRQLSATLRAITSLRTLIRQSNIALVHSSMAWAHAFGGSAAWLAGVPAVWFQHGYAAGRTMLDRVAGRIPAHSLYVNSQSTERAQRAVHTAARSVQLVYCGLDMNRWVLDPATGLALRHEFSIPEHSTLIVMPGRLERWKGQHIFIEAAAQVLQQHPDSRFLIVGDTLFSLAPEYKEELRAQVERLGLTEQIKFAGMREDMVAIYSAADIVIHASLTPEPFGLIIAEAMAMRRPVIASDSGGPQEIVISGETGYLVPSGDITTLAARIMELINTPQLRADMGAAGYTRVHERFSMERVIAQLETDYEQILTKK
ncbi:MAG: glycosyltransferase [Acidobacteriota bacterium]